MTGLSSATGLSRATADGQGDSTAGQRHNRATASQDTAERRRTRTALWRSAARLRTLWRSAAMAQQDDGVVGYGRATQNEDGVARATQSDAERANPKSS